MLNKGRQNYFVENSKLIYCFLSFLLLSSLAFLLHGCSNTSKDSILFADASTVWWTAPTIIARTHDLFTKEGLTVRTFNVTDGLASKNAVVSGNADIGLVASTPLAIGASKKEKIVILGSYVESSSLLALISRISTIEKSSLDDLKKTLKVGYVPQTISEFYLLQYLKKHKLFSIKDEFEKLALPPPSIPIVFQKKDVNTVVIWEPFATQIINPINGAAEDSLIVTRDTELYTLRLYLITTPDVWEKKRNAVENFVRAVACAGDEIQHNKFSIRKEIEHYFNYPDGWLEERWKDVDFSFKTDVGKIKDLILQDARLAKEVGILETVPDIDYMLTEVSKIESILPKTQ